MVLNKIVLPFETLICCIEISPYNEYIHVSQINWDQSAQDIHNFIRGNDKVPGAWTKINGEQITLFGSRMWTRMVPRGTEIAIEGASRPAIVHKNGMVLFGNDGKMVS